MYVTRKQAHMINQVLRMIAIHGMAQVRDLYIEAGDSADFEGIHFIIILMAEDLKLIKLMGDGNTARLTLRGKCAGKTGVRFYLFAKLSSKVTGVVAGVCTILSFIAWLLQLFGRLQS